MKKILTGILMSVLLVLPLFSFSMQTIPSSASGGRTNFITSSVDIDTLLRRPYEQGVPLGFSDNIFALYSSGWGFDQTSIFRTGLTQGYNLPVTLTVDNAVVNPETAIYYPSNVHSRFERDTAIVAETYSNIAPFAALSASFTSPWDNLNEINDGIISYGDPRSRWTNYSDPSSTDAWIEFDFNTHFGNAQLIRQINAYVFAPDVNVQVPASIRVRYFDGANWVDVSNADGGETPVVRKNIITFDSVLTTRLRIYLTPQAGRFVGLTEVEIIARDNVPVENIARTAALSASFTSQWDNLNEINDGIILYTGYPRSRWSNWNSPLRTVTEWIEFDFGTDRPVHRVNAYVFVEGIAGYSGPGVVRTPQSISVRYFDGSEWRDVPNMSGGDSPHWQKNIITFDEVTAERIRVYATPRSGYAISFTEIEVIGRDTSAQLQNIIVDGRKFITQDDLAATVITVTNIGDTAKDVSVSAAVQFSGGYAFTDGMHVSIAGLDFEAEVNGRITRTVSLPAGGTEEFKAAMAFSRISHANNVQKMNTFFADTDWLDTQRVSFSQWWLDNIPFFDIDDPEILQIYYFRWLIYRNHIRLTPDNNYIISEFLPNVPWAGLHNAIAAPGAHHFYEGRWIRDQRYLNDYQDFWFSPGANPRQYSFAIADAYLARYFVSGDRGRLTAHLGNLVDNYNAWIASNYEPRLGLFWSIDDRDGMEYQISGTGYRPTINSYMFGDAIAISRIAAMIGATSTEQLFAQRAETLRNNVHDLLWDPADSFFKNIRRHQSTPFRTRELIGYVPWYFNLPRDEAHYASAWAQMLDPDGFYAPFGPTTAERRDPEFMAEHGHDCLWNGPSWPFATSQTITAAANLLNNYTNHNNIITAANHFNMLRTFARSHYRNGYPWLAENLDADTGEWIVDVPRSVNYNHSTFVDLVITGLVGLRPADCDEFIVVNPLIPDTVNYFALENVLYRGRNITVLFDRDGTRYNQGVGLIVFVDGERVAESANVQRLEVCLTGDTGGQNGNGGNNGNNNGQGENGNGENNYVNGNNENNYQNDNSGCGTVAAGGGGGSGLAVIGGLFLVVVLILTTKNKPQSI